MKDIYLKFTNEVQARAALVSFGFEQDESGTFYLSGVCIDVIGVIYTTDNPDAEEPEYTSEPGWHINLRIVDEIDTSALAPFMVNPDTPARVWA